MARASHLEKELEETDPPSHPHWMAWLGRHRQARGLSYTTGEEEGQWSHHGTLQVTDSGSQSKASSGENLGQNNRPRNRVKAVPWQSAPNRWHPLTPPAICPSSNLVTSLPFQFLSQSEPLLCLSSALTQPQLALPCPLFFAGSNPQTCPQTPSLQAGLEATPSPQTQYPSMSPGWAQRAGTGVRHKRYNSLRRESLSHPWP